jgi:unspecific monooxygenase
MVDQMNDRIDVSEINFLSSEVIADPYPYYDLMRESSPILYRQDWGMYFLTAYEDVNNLLRDRRLGRQFSHVMSREEVGYPPIPEAHAPFYHFRDNVLMDKEPPEHTRLKSLVSKAFTPRMVEKLRPYIQKVSDVLADKAMENHGMELLEDFAAPLSVTVISELLGVPEANRHRLRPWSNQIVAMYELGASEDDRIAANAVRAVIEFSDYLCSLVELRRPDPKDDLLSALISVEEEGERLSEDELIATCMMVLNAGHEATVNALGNGILALLKNPNQLEMLKEDPSLIGTAVEEILRYDTPLPLFRRFVLEDMEYKNVKLRKGTEVAFLLGSANRDPDRFPNPHTFDITRKDNPHLSFGMGVHYCLGAPLARVELQVAVNTLLQRFSHIRLGIETPVQKPTFVFRGVESLPLIIN